MKLFNLLAEKLGFSMGGRPYFEAKSIACQNKIQGKAWASREKGNLNIATSMEHVNKSQSRSKSERLFR